MRETALSPRTNYTLSLTSSDGTTGSQNLGKIGPQSCIRVVSTAACFISFKLGSAPTAATTTDMYIPAGVPEYIGIDRFADQGDLYIKGIVASSTATLYVSVCE